MTDPSHLSLGRLSRHEPIRERLRALKVFAGDLAVSDVAEAPAEPADLYRAWLIGAMDAGVREPHALTLSTVDQDGRPTSRVIGAVYRSMADLVHRESVAHFLTALDLPPDDALDLWLDALAAAGALTPSDVELRPLLEAADDVCAARVHALHADPVSRCAAMDGIAVRASDTASATPSDPVALGPDRYATVDTGQAIAARWDAVVPSEQLDRVGDQALVRVPAAPGRHIRRAGENGAPIIEAGRRLTAYDVALAAACGHTMLAVHRGPRVAVIPTGDEIRPAGSTLAPGEAIDANSIMLATLLRQAGAQALVTPIIPDGGVALARQVERSCEDADLVLIIAGSARGTRDTTAAVLERLGSVVVRGVALRPAHPVILGRIGRVGVVGMPGYPVSTALAFERFVRPLLDRLSGAVSAQPTYLFARLASSISGRADAEVECPVSLRHNAPDELPEAIPGSHRGSALARLARAEGTVSVPAGTDHLSAGDIVRVELLPAARGQSAPAHQPSRFAITDLTSV
jgi:putative molybdopterin biosynthesis protein